jgi:hypothetical protein
MARRADDEFAGIAARLSAELRAQIKGLQFVPRVGGGSSERQARLDSLARLCRVAHIVESERALRLQRTASGKPSNDGSSGGTSLWEGSEEQALRFLIEGAKVNLLLRMVEDHCEGVLRSRPDEGAVATLSEGGGGDGGGDPTQAGHALEFGAAVLLPSVWAHREGCQVTDWPLAARSLARLMLCFLAKAERAPLGAGAGQPLAVAALRWLAAAGGDACAGAVGDKVVAALGAAGVWALLPQFLVECAAQLGWVAEEGGDGGAARAIKSAPGAPPPPPPPPTGDFPTSPGSPAAAAGGGGGAVIVGAPLEAVPLEAITAEAVLEAAYGAGALAAREHWAATVKPGLPTGADGAVAALVAEAGGMESESGAVPSLLAPGARGGGLALRRPHVTAASRLRALLVDGLLGEVAAAAGGKAAAGALGGVVATGRRKLRPLLDYGEWAARTAKRAP